MMTVFVNNNLQYDTPNCACAGACAGTGTGAGAGAGIDTLCFDCRTHTTTQSCAGPVEGLTARTSVVPQGQRTCKTPNPPQRRSDAQTRLSQAQKYPEGSFIVSPSFVALALRSWDALDDTRFLRARLLRFTFFFFFFFPVRFSLRPSGTDNTPREKDW